LLVHYAILSHTTWFSAYWQGGTKKSAQIEMQVVPAPLSFIG
jgi:light-harvesting protein B-800-850 alpha chain